MNRMPKPGDIVELGGNPNKPKEKLVVLEIDTQCGSGACHVVTSFWPKAGKIETAIWTYKRHAFRLIC